MGNKTSMVAKYKEIRDNNKEPVQYTKWTSADDDALEALRNKEIAIGDTALGGLQETHKREIETSFIAMSPGGSKADTIERLKELDTRENNDE